MPDEQGKNTNTQIQYLILMDFLRQKCLGERASVLRYGHVACLAKKYGVLLWID